MSIAKLRSSTAIEMVQTFGSVADEPKMTLGQSDHDQSNNSNQGATPNTAAERVSLYLRDVSGHSTDEIDSLIRDLNLLRQRLVADSSRIERDLLEFATLNDSVISLTKIVSDGVTHVKEPQTT